MPRLLWDKIVEKNTTIFYCDFYENGEFFSKLDFERNAVAKSHESGVTDFKSFVRNRQVSQSKKIGLPTFLGVIEFYVIFVLRFSL